MKQHIPPLFALLGGLVLPVPGAPPASPENPIVELTAVLAPGQTCQMRPAEDLPLFATRAAKRVLDKLRPGEPVTILAIDRYGLKVRGNGENGPLTGWVGRKSALGNDSKRLAALEAIYKRQLLVEGLIARKRPAIGMTLRELTRIYGPATSHNIVAEGDKRTETAVWVFSEQVDLDDTLGLGTNTDLFKVDVETGRVTVDLVDGTAHSIDVNLKGIANDIPTVPEPIVPPFLLSPGNPLTAQQGQ